MIRNKRLLKEQNRLNYEIHWPLDWIYQNDICLKTVQSDILLYIKINKDYPFKHPNLIVHTNIKNPVGVEYIQWLLNKKSKNNDLINNFKIHIPCVCCDTITCFWSPAYGIKEMIDEFNKYYQFFYILEKFKIIYKKINMFDELIYNHIIEFLYLRNI